MAIPILSDEEAIEILSEVKEGLSHLDQLFEESLIERIFFDELTRSNPATGTP